MVAATLVLGKVKKLQDWRCSSNDEMNEVPELLKGVCFTIARDGPDLYPKALERLGVNVCATYKNGADLEMCLEAEELILPEEPVLPENPMAHTLEQ